MYDIVINIFHYKWSMGHIVHKSYRGAMGANVISEKYIIKRKKY